MMQICRCCVYSIYLEIQAAVGQVVSMKVVKEGRGKKMLHEETRPG